MSYQESSSLALSMERDPVCPLDPPPPYARLRKEAPVSRVTLWGGKQSAWLVTRWEDARTLLTSPGVSVDRGHANFPGNSAQEMPPGFFVGQDDPLHTVFRTALTREFMVKRVEALRGPTRQILAGLLDGLEARGGPVDFVEEVALPLPSLVICALLGVPYGDHSFFQEHSRTLIDITVSDEEKVAAHIALGDYLEEMVRDRLRNPKDDLVGRLAVHTESGTFSVRDAADVGAFLLFAGHETTANMIGLGVLALLDHPEQRERLYQGQTELANAVEELLRFLSIAHVGLSRVVTQDVRLGDVTIPAGDGVVIMLNSANRDEDVFPGGDALDLMRVNARQHVAFGYGVHQCLGQPLARMELQMTLPEVFRRLPGLRVAPGEKVEFKDDSAAYGARHMPVTW
ncbi:cytochrome P450 [Streptomyces sp. NPDC088387]|uniref:cytochrome P450 n=1 Tax=Streptomyces sp. NPDC088387 TaxID=3365859 RepID=UPI0037FB9EEE